MADSRSSGSSHTPRTLLRRVLDTADPRTPRRPRSARAGAQRALLETSSSRRLSGQTKTTARWHSHGAKSVGRLSRVQASGHLEGQTPRTLLKNILLTAPESSILMPESVVKPVPALQGVQPSRQESSRGSLELQLPELEPPTTLAPGLLITGRRKQRLRLSMFQQGIDQGLPLSQEPHGSANASSLTSSLNLTFATPLQPQSVRRPGLARRPPTRRAVNVSAFLRDVRGTSLASAPPGDSLRTPVTTLPRDVMLEDTQPFSQPLVSCSPSVSCSLHHSSRTGAEDVERTISRRTQSSGQSNSEMQSNSPRKPAQFLSGKEEEVDALALGFLNTSSNISAEDGVEPLQDGFGKKAVKRMEEGLNMSEVKEATGAQGPAGAEKPKGHTKVTEAERSQGAVEAEELEGSSGHDDTSGSIVSHELVSRTPKFLQAKQLGQFLEPAPPPGAAVLSSEPMEPLLARLPPRPRTTSTRPRQDPYRSGLSHYVKLFSFYAKMPVEKRALEMVEKCLDKYFQHLCDDLEVFAAHAGRKTVKPEDLELLMRRQGLITDQVSLHVLVERHLPLEYRQLLIPCAFSGNSVFPAQ
ncbi:PREDICTED: centromere protein T [Galeopterus variegatus]|uniref:Centromere protein T n=1 Tax=Galeopterus variegatus TaxID=482537 RepID=A0ABM0QBB4_GALVR|nr:PREDICTED: centromere protein T [Galeopterus variegatus]